mgnify:CR=1 FL=1
MGKAAPEGTALLSIWAAVAEIELNGTAIIDFHDTEEARSFAGIGAAVTQEAHNTMK